MTFKNFDLYSNSKNTHNFIKYRNQRIKVVSLKRRTKSISTSIKSLTRNINKSHKKHKHDDKEEKEDKNNQDDKVPKEEKKDEPITKEIEAEHKTISKIKTEVCDSY